jgi:hypothetical protein
MFIPIIGFHATGVGIPIILTPVPGETLFCGPHGMYPYLSSKVVIPCEACLFVCVSVGPINMKTSKGSHVLTRVGTEASKWELNTISLKSPFGVVMFAKEVHFRVISWLFLFTPHFDTHISTQCNKGMFF